jgi:hypothetical protein
MIFFVRYVFSSVAGRSAKEVDSCDWISLRAGQYRSAGLDASGLCPFVSFEVLRMVRMWILSIQFNFSFFTTHSLRSLEDTESTELFICFPLCSQCPLAQRVVENLGFFSGYQTAYVR